MVPGGFEPPTPALRGQCSTRLSYGTFQTQKLFVSFEASERVIYFFPVLKDYHNLNI